MRYNFTSINRYSNVLIKGCYELMNYYLIKPNATSALLLRFFTNIRSFTDNVKACSFMTFVLFRSSYSSRFELCRYFLKIVLCVLI